MVMDLPVVSTQRPNQRHIIHRGVFVDIQVPGALTAAPRSASREQWRALGPPGPDMVWHEYDQSMTAQRHYIAYGRIAAMQRCQRRADLKCRLKQKIRQPLARLLG